MFLLYLCIEQYQFFSLTFSSLWWLGLWFGVYQCFLKTESSDEVQTSRCTLQSILMHGMWCSEQHSLFANKSVISQLVVTVANFVRLWCQLDCRIPVTAAVMWHDCSRIGSFTNRHLAVTPSLLYIIVVHSLLQIFVHLLRSVMTTARYSVCDIQHVTQKYAHKQMLLPFGFLRYVSCICVMEILHIEEVCGSLSHVMWNYCSSWINIMNWRGRQEIHTECLWGNRETNQFEIQQQIRVILKEVLLKILIIHRFMIVSDWWHTSLLLAMVLPRLLANKTG